MKNFLYIGIDQTGAVNRLGKPKPLPVCTILNNQVNFLYLETFSKKCLIETLGIKSKQKMAICLDCVLGLPQELNLPWQKALELIRTSEGFGRKSASQFFKKLGGGQIFARQVEIKSQANSVFKEFPFQKNIQTGTYRFWKEIAESQNDFAVPFLRDSITADKISLYEGYPSLSWKLLFHLKYRNPKKLPALIKDFFPELVISPPALKMLKKDENLADAFVLALSLKNFKRTSFLKPGYENEGWILGQK